jgi:hypothetical protein
MPLRGLVCCFLQLRQHFVQNGSFFGIHYGYGYCPRPWWNGQVESTPVGFAGT